MLDRRVAGRVPAKHHIAFRDDEGKLLYEECLTRKGFDGPYTLMYHQRKPHTARSVPANHGWAAPEEAGRDRPLKRRHYQSQAMSRTGGAPVDARVPMLFNEDIVLSMVHPDSPDPVYVRNSDADEILYIFKGGGVLRSVLGDLRFTEDDYVVIPKGIIYRIIPDEGVVQEWLSMECPGGVGLLKQWRTPEGQLRMDAPYCHRDFKPTAFQGPMDEGIRTVVAKREGRWHGFEHDASPLDVVGWDGTVYPWVFPMLAFQPRAGLVHLPPDWHGTFSTRGGLICSFVPRTVDFHPEAIPCPYPHSSVDCDEFLFYCRGNFISRRGIGPGSISHHPMGVPHGPHPGAYEGSIGHKTTTEQAVMVDTFKPMRPTAAALTVEDAGYHDSFRE